MTTEELLLITASHEKRTREYKQAWSEVPSNLFETVCAFLNRDGGYVVLGAEDDGSIVRGVNPKAALGMCKNISNLSNNPQKLSPTFLLQPELVQLDDRCVIVIQVPASSQVHKTAGKVFDRSSDGDFELKTDAEISALYLRKSSLYTENTIYPFLSEEHFKTGVVDKAKNLIRNNRSDHPWLALSSEDFFRQSNLYRYDITEGKSGFTLAALMLFGSDEIIQSALPYYKIDLLVRLRDTDRYDDRLTITGNIIDAYDDIMSFLAKHLPDHFYMEGGQRVSLRDKVFREVVANLLIHREYQNHMPTTIVIGRKGIEVRNANRPLKVGPVTLDNYERHPKNPHMANFFVQLGRAEHLGTGVRNIFRYTELYTGRMPQIVDDDMYSVLIPLPAELQNMAQLDTIQKDIQRTIQKRHLSLTSLQSKVLTEISLSPTMSRAEIATAVEDGEGNVINCITALKKKGLIARDGGRRYGCWILHLEHDD